jgi:hypothetical protein
MARERKTNAQQEDVRKDDVRPVAQASEISGLAKQQESTQHKERFHHFLRALARDMARADHDQDS